MLKRRKVNGNSAVDSTMVLGDLTTITQISRSGNVVTVHGEETRSLTLPDEETACVFWQALTEEASLAVSEDRQFFCVSFGAGNSEGTEHTVH